MSLRYIQPAKITDFPPFVTNAFGTKIDLVMRESVAWRSWRDRVSVSRPRTFLLSGMGYELREGNERINCRYQFTPGY